MSPRPGTPPYKLGNAQDAMPKTQSHLHHPKPHPPDQLQHISCTQLTPITPVSVPHILTASSPVPKDPTDAEKLTISKGKKKMTDNTDTPSATSMPGYITTNLWPQEQELHISELKRKLSDALTAAELASTT